MIIDIEDIDRIIKARQEFNKLDLADVEFYQDGIKLDIPKEVIGEFKFTGLSPISFVEIRYWEIGVGV